jgi:hypothetical protein
MSIESRMTEELQDLQDEAQSLRERVAALEADLAASVPRAVAERACRACVADGYEQALMNLSLSRELSALDTLRITYAALGAAEREAAE